jgi:hypothetical protein
MIGVIFSPEKPRHSMFDNSKVMKRMEKSMYLDLKFTSVDQKIDFVKKFDDKAVLEK